MRSVAPGRDFPSPPLSLLKRATRRFELEISAILVDFREAVFNEVLGDLLDHYY